MLKSLRSRLVGSYVLVVSLSLLLGLLTLLVVIRPVLTRLTYATLLDKALPTARLLNELAQQEPSIVDLRTRLQEQATEQSVRILVAEARGRILVDTGGTLEGRLTASLVQQRPDANTRYVLGRFRPDSANLLYVAVQVALRREDTAVPRAHLLILAVPARSAWGILRDLLSGFVWAGLVALLVAVVLALWITRSLGAPVKKIAAAAHAIAQGDYDQQLVIEYPSEMKEVAASFNQMAHDVKQSRQAMRDFVANVSHELKTPLTSIRGFADAIVDGAAQGQAEQQHAAAVIRDEAMRMTRMVEQLLDLSRIESGQVAMGHNPVPVDELLRNCVERLSLAAQEKGVQLVCDCAPVPPLLGDGDRLAQVFTNLLDNALQHTPAGGKVTASARVTTESSAPGGPELVQVAVTDTGEGIPAAELERVFERFYQVDKSRARTRGGVGLGLAIAKGIVEAHGGRIWAESVVGLGTRFVVRLPLSA
jgi:two-component system OmpR family sensor kinase